MNCTKCNVPMKEYLGLRETGWDCVNDNCGKALQADSVNITIPGGGSGDNYHYKIYRGPQPGEQWNGGNAYALAALAVETGDVKASEYQPPGVYIAPYNDLDISLNGDIGFKIPSIEEFQAALKEKISDLCKGGTPWFNEDMILNLCTDIYSDCVMAAIHTGYELYCKPYTIETAHGDSLDAIAQQYGLVRNICEYDDEFRFRIAVIFRQSLGGCV